jgi:hypothetical protein
MHVKYHIGGTISMITNYGTAYVKNNTVSSRSLFDNKGRKRINENNSNKYIYSYRDAIAINSLDIADGLKELLSKYRFTLNELITISSSELAKFLGIDKYVAQIFGGKAARLSDIDEANGEWQTLNYITF